jgi:hypothetical protein
VDSMCTKGVVGRELDTGGATGCAANRHEREAVQLKGFLFGFTSGMPNLRA